MQKSDQNSLLGSDSYHDEYPSPNTKYKVVLSGSTLGGKVFLIHNRQRHLIWLHPHSISCYWNPDSSYIALGGNDAAGSPGYIVVVSLRTPGHPMFIYQTPYSASNGKISFEFNRWGRSNDLHIDIYNRRQRILTFVESNYSAIAKGMTIW